MNGNIGIQVGASPEAVRAARDGIEAILRTDRDEETVRVALRAFLRVCDVSGVLINGATITMPPTPPEGFAIDGNAILDPIDQMAESDAAQSPDLSPEDEAAIAALPF